MPYMTRQEIINKYGFDPGLDENQSIYEKRQDLEEQSQETRIAPQLPPMQSTGFGDIPDQSAVTPPPQVAAETSSGVRNENRETPTEDPAKMFVSGAIRGYISDPLLLAGIASAGLSAAARSLSGDRDFKENFSKGLYKEGGLEAVQNNLREHQQQITTEHPDWSPEQVHREMLAYQAKPEFFDFHTDQMAGAYGAGMKLARLANQATGSGKTPEQETWMDQAAQMIGSVVIPSPGIFARGTMKFAAALGMKAPNLLERTAKVADAIVLPGTSAQHYTPGVLAGSVGAGLAVNEATRLATGEPSAIRGDAFTPRDPVVGGPTDNAAAAGLGARPGDYAIPATGAALSAGLLARALRGRARIDPHVVHGGPTVVEQQAALRAQQGLEPLRDPSLGEQVSQAINEWAQVEKLGRDVADEAEKRAALTGGTPQVTRDQLEVDLQAAHGLEMSRPARESAFTRAREEGSMPDGSKSEVTLSQLEQRARASSPEAVQKFNEAVTAFNVGDQRIRGMRELMGAYTANPTDADVLRRLAGRLADTPQSRPSFSGWSDRDIGARVNAAMADPEAAELITMLGRVNRATNLSQFRAGLITQDDYLRRQGQPLHIPLFEFAEGGSYNPNAARATTVDPAQPGVVPNNTIDPITAANMHMARVVDDVKLNNGKRQVITALQGGDPNGEFVQRVGPSGSVPSRTPDMVSVFENGQEVLYRFSRQSVADALTAQPLTLGPLASVANRGRQLFHRMTTGPLLGGVPTAVRSAFYDATAGYATARQGRSFGYLSKWARLAAGNNDIANMVVDTARGIDPTAPLQMMSAFAQMGVLRSIDAVGRRLMDAAVARNGVLGQVAEMGGRDWLDAAGSAMAQRVEGSLYGVMKGKGILEGHAMMTGASAQLDQFSQLANRYNNTRFARAANTVLSPWMAVVNNIHNSAKYAFFASNYSALERRFPNGIPPVELNRLAEETRRMSGDIQAIGGSKGYNEAMAFVPYGNIGIQALRHLTHAMYSQGSKQAFDVQLRMGLLGASAYAGIKYIEDLGVDAKDWYWNQQNDFERVGTIPIPSASAIEHRIKTGQWPQFNRDKPSDSISTVKLAAELAPFTQAWLGAAEMTGLLNRGDNDANGNMYKDLSGTIGNAINLGNIQGLNLGLAVGGAHSTIDFLNPMKGRGAVATTPQPRGEGGRLPGGIPTQAAEVAKQLAGFGGDVLIASLDAGGQVLERGGSFADALARAGLEGKSRMIDERMPTVPGLWKGSDRIYAMNAEGVRLKALERTEKLLDQTWSREFGKGHMTMAQTGTIQDPEVKSVMAIGHAFFSQGSYKALQNERARLESMRSGLDSKKDQLTPEQIVTEKRSIDMRIRGVQNQMMNVVRMYEGSMARSHGDVFKRHGLEPKLENVDELVTRYKRKTPR